MTSRHSFHKWCMLSTIQTQDCRYCVCAHCTWTTLGCRMIRLACQPLDKQRHSVGSSQCRVDCLLPNMFRTKDQATCRTWSSSLLLSQRRKCSYSRVQSEHCLGSEAARHGVCPAMEQRSSGLPRVVVKRRSAYQTVVSGKRSSKSCRSGEEEIRTRTLYCT